MSDILNIPYQTLYYRSIASRIEAIKALDSLIIRREKIKAERKLRASKTGLSSKWGEQALSWIRNQIRNVRALIIRLEKEDAKQRLLWGC